MGSVVDCQKASVKKNQTSFLNFGMNMVSMLWSLVWVLYSLLNMYISCPGSILHNTSLLGTLCYHRYKMLLKFLLFVHWDMAKKLFLQGLGQVNLGLSSDMTKTYSLSSVRKAKTCLSTDMTEKMLTWLA